MVTGSGKYAQDLVAEQVWPFEGRHFRLPQAVHGPEIADCVEADAPVATRSARLPVSIPLAEAQLLGVASQSKTASIGLL